MVLPTLVGGDQAQLPLKNVYMTTLSLEKTAVFTTTQSLKCLVICQTNQISAIIQTAYMP